MGMSAASGAKGGSGRRGRRGRRHGAIAEINMTPFIDVMLVLLIIFMVAAPLIATGVPLDLPQTGAKPINVDQKPLTIAIDSKGQIFLQDEPTLEPDLVAKLQGLAKQGFDERIYVRGDKASIRSARDAMDLGIETIHQDTSLAPDLSIARNLFLGRQAGDRGIGDGAGNGDGGDSEAGRHIETQPFQPVIRQACGQQVPSPHRRGPANSPPLPFGRASRARRR